MKRAIALLAILLPFLVFFTLVLSEIGWLGLAKVLCSTALALALLASICWGIYTLGDGK